MLIAPLTVEHAESVKNSVWKLVERGAAIDNGRTSPEEIWASVLEGRSKLWLVIDEEAEPKKIVGLVLTAIVHYPAFDACDIQLCVGDDIRFWLHLLSDIEKWAEEQGCKTMELTGRKGWGRYLEDYRLRRVIMVKSL